MNQYARLKVFSLVFGIAYVGLFLYSEFYKHALFRYYPVLARFDRAALPLETAGPPILWYSWLVGAAAISFVAALIVPRGWAERLGQGWVCGIPAALLLGILVYERRWFY